jgi:hypothetical protein
MSGTSDAHVASSQPRAARRASVPTASGGGRSVRTQASGGQACTDAGGLRLPRAADTLPNITHPEVKSDRRSAGKSR